MLPLAFFIMLYTHTRLVSDTTRLVDEPFLSAFPLAVHAARQCAQGHSLLKHWAPGLVTILSCQRRVRVTRKLTIDTASLSSDRQVGHQSTCFYLPQYR